MRVWVGAVLAVVVCIVVGGSIGYAVGGSASGTGSSSYAPAPMAASPSLPVDVISPYAADSDFPPLPTHLDYVRTTVGAAGLSQWQIVVPKGWNAVPAFPAGTMLWRPASLPGYRLRAEPLGGRESISDHMAWQEKNMPTGTVVEHKNATTVWFDYRDPQSNLHRFDYFTWVPVPGTDVAGLEISVAGRAADVPGLNALMRRVRDSAQQMLGAQNGPVSASPSG